MQDKSKLENVIRERREIHQVIGDLTQYPKELPTLIAELKEVNLQLWDVEDGKRDCERRKVFDAQFVDLARKVYFGNDKRAAIKRQINELLGSTLVEEKSYKTY